MELAELQASVARNGDVQREMALKVIVVVYFQQQHKTKYIIVEYNTTQFAKHNINIVIKFVDKSAILIYGSR